MCHFDSFVLNLSMLTEQKFGDKTYNALNFGLKIAPAPSLRASKASVAIQKVKIMLNLWLATPFSQKRLAMTRLLSY